jgi:AbiA family abortive infection protein
MQEYSSFHLGHFLRFELWQDAKKLLDHQIKQVDDNKHYNTFCMFYYKKIFADTEIYDTEEYYKKKIANGLFYILQREFAIKTYSKPKVRFGIRNFRFLTYPMKVLYYSIGLYFLRLSQEFLNEYVKKQTKIKSYYGGNLYFKDNKLVFNKKNTYYFNFYKKFRKEARKNIQENRDDKLVFRLDIQNYYDEISTKILIDMLELYIKPGIKSEQKFDSLTKEQIRCFFDYILEGSRGIVQSDNNIVSAFIGHLYFSFIDLDIECKIENFQRYIKDYRIIRYVDDIFIFLEFDRVDDKERISTAEILLSEISDLLYYKFGLRLNSKTSFYWLKDPDELKELLKQLKRTSPDYPIASEEDEENKDKKGKNSPQDKVEAILQELEQLKSQLKNILRKDTDEIREEIFKDVYDKHINQILNKKEYKKRIRAIFTDFNFDLVKISSKEITIIILKDKQSSTQFRQYLMNKNNPTTRDAELIINFLCQTQFGDVQLLDILKSSDYFKEIVDLYENADLNTEKPGCYELSQDQISSLYSSDSHIIEQAVMRVTSERRSEYSLALNHLLNEIHRICFIQDPSENKLKDYNAENCITYLRSKNVSHEICIGIRNLFDQRNRNKISHPGSEEYAVSEISREIYLKYRNIVANCLATILR